MRLLIFLSLFLLAACATAPRGAQDPLRHDPAALAGAERIAIFIPGALSSVDVFAGSDIWEDAGYARAFYRYPGLDGMALDHYVDPPTAAARVAALANAYPLAEIVMVGYSTGALVALEAAPQITKGRPVRIAALSPAVEYAGGIETLGRGLRDILGAVAATGSVRKADIWKYFWSGLLFGPEALRDPQMAAPVAAKVRQGEEIYVRLDLRIALAHILALPGWDLPRDLDLSGTEVAFFIGMNDPVFSPRQSTGFAANLGGVTVYGYPGQGHLLFFTRPDVFEDMLAFAQGRDPRD